MSSLCKNRKPDQVQTGFIANRTWLLAHSLDLHKQAGCNFNRLAELLDNCAASQTTNLATTLVNLVDSATNKRTLQHNIASVWSHVGGGRHEFLGPMCVWGQKLIQGSNWQIRI
jgi:hypothetical protein